MTKTIRNIVKTVLAENGKSNKFSVKGTNFTCSRFGNGYYAVTIKGWTPDPSADAIKASIKARCDHERIGVLMDWIIPGPSNA